MVRSKQRSFPIWITINAKDDVGSHPDFVVPEQFTSDVVYDKMFVVDFNEEIFLTQNTRELLIA